MNWRHIEDAAHELGLVLRGGFVPEPEDQVPSLADGKPAQTLILLGNVGSSLWAHFCESPEYQDQQANPLDRWSRRLTDRLAERFQAMALYPFAGPPYHPFLRWAQKAEPVSHSPLGLLIHPEYGLWHAYRGALAFDTVIDDLPKRPIQPFPCSQCPDKPCLQGCPVGAFTGVDYRVDRCMDFITDSPVCPNTGCAARNACPVGERYRYQVDHHRFHLQAFIHAQLQRRG